MHVIQEIHKSGLSGWGAVQVLSNEYWNHWTTTHGAVHAGEFRAAFEYFKHHQCALILVDRPISITNLRID